jgi:Rod binding domain-containing protein
MDGLQLPTGQASIAARGASEHALDALRARANADEPAVAAKKFEALFATLLVKEMRQSLSEGFFGSGPHADVYAGWLDSALGEALAQDGSLHLADGVRESLERKHAAERAGQQATAETTRPTPEQTAARTRLIAAIERAAPEVRP